MFDTEKELILTPQSYLQAVVDEKLTALQQEIDELEESLSSISDEEMIESTATLLAEKYDIHDDMKTTAEKHIANTLEELRFEPHLHKCLSQLSSGWRYKCRLAASFLAQPDLLIIDEPSFLDTHSTNWLIRRMSDCATSGNAMVLLISHKECLLQALCNRIIYINSANHTLVTYNVSYAQFRELIRNEASQGELACAEHQQRVHDADKSLKKIQTDLQSRERSLHRATSENSDQRFIKGKNKESKQKADRSAAAKVKQLKNRAAEMEDIKFRAQREQVKPLKITGAVGDGSIVILQDVGYSYDDNSDHSPVFEGVTACLDSQDRVLLTGPNGCGKSTLLQLILQESEPSSGTVVNRGKAVYFPQNALSEVSAGHGHETAMSYLGDGLTETAARQHLGEFGIKGDVALRSVMSLSAGQRVRLCLAKQLLHVTAPSLLVMDETSENLDVETRQSLSDVLNSFVGAVIVVSHDQDFCTAFHPTQIWHLHMKGIRIEHTE